MNYKVKIDGEEIVVSQEDIDNMIIHSHQPAIVSFENNLFKASNTSGQKEGQITINNEQFGFQILNEYDQIVEQLGMDVVEEVKTTNIYAPMPGLILDIAVKEGDEVEEGQTILILEAMKMENVIKASGKGTVQSILFNLNDKVEKGQLIIEID